MNEDTRCQQSERHARDDDADEAQATDHCSLPLRDKRMDVNAGPAGQQPPGQFVPLVSLLGIAVTVVMAASVVSNGVIAFFGYISAILIAVYAVLQLTAAPNVRVWASYILVAFLALVAGAESVIFLLPR